MAISPNGIFKFLMGREWGVTPLLSRWGAGFAVALDEIYYGRDVAVTNAGVFLRTNFVDSPPKLTYFEFSSIRYHVYGFNPVQTIPFGGQISEIVDLDDSFRILGVNGR
jgi:hypothetical protein